MPPAAPDTLQCLSRGTNTQIPFEPSATLHTPLLLLSSRKASSDLHARAQRQILKLLFQAGKNHQCLKKLSDWGSFVPLQLAEGKGEGCIKSILFRDRETPWGSTHFSP